MNIKQLSPSEKILLAEELWESVRIDASNSELTDAQRRELDSRLAAFEFDREIGDGWDAVKSRITAR